MTVYHTLKFRKKTITNRQIITVEQVMKLMLFWKIIIWQAKEFLTNIC